MNVSFLQKVFLGLLLCLVAVYVIEAIDLKGAALWFLATMESLIGNLFGMSTLDDQIAMDSTQALSCAVDTTALCANGASCDMFSSASCRTGMPVSYVIARNAPKHGLMTAHVIAAAEKITGDAILPPAPGANQCGTDKCGMVNIAGVNTYGECKLDERCVWKTVGWWCEKDETCIAPSKRAQERASQEGVESRCFGNDMHVCVVCGNETNRVVDKKCCECEELNGNIHYNYIPANARCSNCIGLMGRCGDAADSSACDGRTSVTSCAVVTEADSRNGFYCDVLGFELPQDVTMGDGYFAKVADYGKAWIGAIGEPRYLVYYETFPHGIESTWIYEPKDMIIAAVAIGGVMNLGGGTLKAGWSGAKAGAAGLGVVRKAGIKRAIGHAVKEAKGATYERLSYEYAGKAGLVAFNVEKFVLKKHGGSVIGLDNVRAVTDDVMGRRILANAPDTSTIRRVFGENMDDLTIDQYSALTDYALFVRGGRNIEKESVETIAKEWNLGLTDTRITTITTELNQLRGMHELRNFMDEGGEVAITAAVKKTLKDSPVLKDKLKKSFAKVFMEQKGKAPGFI